jgi:imidazolonepropionase-like amidohydrolase
MRALWEGRNERILEAHEAGVQVFAGTDAGSVIRHGRIADEILALHAAGLPAAAALDAACWGARRWLGAEGLAEGASADVVLCTEDPREVPGTIRDLRGIVLRGRVVRLGIN